MLNGSELVNIGEPCIPNVRSTYLSPLAQAWNVERYEYNSCIDIIPCFVQVPSPAQ